MTVNKLMEEFLKGSLITKSKYFTDERFFELLNPTFVRYFDTIIIDSNNEFLEEKEEFNQETFDIMVERFFSDKSNYEWQLSEVLVNL